MQKTTIEIASYPKSGNTWMRHLVGAFLTKLGFPRNLPMDIHQSKDRVTDRPWFALGNSSVSFYKSHLPFNEAVQPDVVIYIYRHPLDVLLSTLNYQAMRGHKRLFRNGVVKSVEEIHKDNEISFYYERFKNDLGLSFWPGLLHELSNIMEHTKYVNYENVVPVRYEDLFDYREQSFSQVMERALGSKGFDMNGVFDIADRETKDSGKRFFWKAKKNTREEYFSQDMLMDFAAEHRDWLAALGYTE